MPLHQVQVQSGGVWVTVESGSLLWCDGYMAGRRASFDLLPPMRRLAPNGCAYNTTGARDEAPIGQIAGHATAEQYEAAARRMLERAALVRERERRREARRAP